MVPTPSRLLEVDQLPGLPADRIPRLHAIAEAAQRGDLAVDRLTALGVDAAKTELQRLPGIGPFYSALITVRACGLTDVLATEPQVLKHLEATYGRSVDAAELEQLAEAWRPWRTWVTVMLRALGGRPDAEDLPMPEGDTVWRACRRLHGLLAGEQLTRAEFRVPQLAVTDLTGVTVLDVTPRGKHQLFRFDNGWTLHTHFRMEGAWRTYPSGRRWSGGPDHEIRAVLGTADTDAVGYRLPVVELLADRGRGRRWSVTSGPDLLGPDWDPDEALRRIRAPTGHARSARPCSTSATWPASAPSTAPSCCSCRACIPARRCRR